MRKNKETDLNQGAAAVAEMAAGEGAYVTATADEGTEGTEDTGTEGGGTETETTDPKLFVYDATQYGLATANDGVTNSNALQALVDQLNEKGGGTIYIPAGIYRFGKTLNHMSGGVLKGWSCVRWKSNVSLVGDGTTTILMPTGYAEKGLCMFVYPEIETGNSEESEEAAGAEAAEGTQTATGPVCEECIECPEYPCADCTGETEESDTTTDTGVYMMENCNFRDFVVDEKNVCIGKVYETLGKAFMFSPLKNCHWERVIVKNTTATGFGVDNPINCSFIHCKAYNCGRGATSEEHVGASGFGIGFGYSPEESMTIIGCEAYKCFNHGFFFEHQGRFNEEIDADDSCSFHISNCVAGCNRHNYAAIMGIKVHFDNCYSFKAEEFGFFLHNSRYCKVTNCDSYEEEGASFVIKYDNDRDRNHKCQYNIVQNCNSIRAPYGLKVVNTNEASKNPMAGNIVRNCNFLSPTTLSVVTMGQMDDLTLMGNYVIGDPGTSFSDMVDTFINKDNSWNTEFVVVEESGTTDPVLVTAGTTQQWTVSYTDTHETAPTYVFATAYNSNGQTAEVGVLSNSAETLTINLKNTGTDGWFKVMWQAVWK